MRNEKINFPDEGWCEKANKDLKKYLSKKYNMDELSDKGGGYAWNDYGYWSVKSYSNKVKYTLEELGFSKKVSTSVEKNKFSVGDIVTTNSYKYIGITPGEKATISWIEENYDYVSVDTDKVSSISIFKKDLVPVSLETEIKEKSKISDIKETIYKKLYGGIVHPDDCFKQFEQHIPIVGRNTRRIKKFRHMLSKKSLLHDTLEDVSFNSEMFEPSTFILFTPKKGRRKLLLVRRGRIKR